MKNEYWGWENWRQLTDSQSFLQVIKLALQLLILSDNTWCQAQKLMLPRTQEDNITILTCIYFYFAILASRRKNLLSQRNLGVKNIFEQKKIILQILKHQSDKRSIISLLLLCLSMSRVMAIRVYWKIIYFNILLAFVPKVCNWVWVNKRKNKIQIRGPELYLKWPWR